MSKHNVSFAHLMDTTGDSYLAALYLMKIGDASNQGNTDFIQKKQKTRTDKLAAYYRFTTTELDMEATTFKEAISNQKNYVKDECFLTPFTTFTATTF